MDDEQVTYDGAETLTSKDQIKLYLSQNYIVDPEYVEQIIAQHTNLIQGGIDMLSFVSYIGDNIADIEALYEKSTYDGPVESIEP